MSYQDALPYLYTGVVYTIGWLFGHHRGKRNAEAEIARMKALAQQAIDIAQKAARP